MKIETDLEKIANWANKNQKANWEFRCRVKMLEILPEELDEIVHNLDEEISGQIDCRTCANCCKVISPVLSKNDIKRLAKHLHLSRKAFIEKYLTNNPEDGEFTFKSMPCPFLSDNLCTVYPDRPKDCRSYPHLHKNDFVSRVTQAYKNASMCPIVYNVYERLKVELSEYDQISIEYEIDEY